MNTMTTNAPRGAVLGLLSCLAGCLLAGLASATVLALLVLAITAG